LHRALDAVGEKVRRVAGKPERFAPAVERALLESKSFTRHPVGFDAALMLYGSHVLPTRAMQSLTARVIRLPRKHR
jgi:hypothetical protein